MKSIHVLICTCLAIAGCSHSDPIAKAPVAKAEPIDPLSSKALIPPKKLIELELLKIDKPSPVRGIYLTAWSAGSKKKRAQVEELVANTTLNTVVIDLRDTGEMYAKMGIKLADESKATELAIRDPKAVVQEFIKKGIYPVARIACFRDNFVPKKHPERGVQLKGGKIWRDRSGHSWLDPYNKANWEYVGQVVDFALDCGFPEVQLDYVRFPSEGKSATQVFPSKGAYGDPKAKPEDVIAAFAEAMRAKAKARGATISADIFGIISSTKGDEGIGQSLEKVAAPFDLVSPMVYPSHFAKGEYGIKDPNASPYAIVLKSLKDYKKRIPNKPLRPWLQDFSLGRKYGEAEVKAQIKAVQDAGYSDFLLWNAGNRYTGSALKKPKAS